MVVQKIDLCFFPIRNLDDLVLTLIADRRYLLRTPGLCIRGRRRRRGIMRSWLGSLPSASTGIEEWYIKFEKILKGYVFGRLTETSSFPFG